MASVRVFVGLDYHDDEIPMCVVSADEKGAVLCNRRLPNSAAAVVAVASLHGAVQAAAIEACCGAANLAQELRDLGWSVSLAHAGFVARMKQNPDKIANAIRTRFLGFYT